MTRSANDLTALKAELTNDPNTLGLTLLPADDAVNADKLNEVLATQQIDREAIPVSEVAAVVDRDEYNSLSLGDRQWLQMVTAGGSINPRSGSKTREGLLQLFKAGTETRTGLVGLLTEPANRINQLFKQGLLDTGGAITPSDVAQARQA